MKSCIVYLSKLPLLRWLFRYWQRIAWLCLFCCIGLLLSRNFLARVVLVAVSNRLLAAQVQIEQVYIGWNHADIIGLQIYELRGSETDATPLFCVKKITGVWAIADGFTNGKWLTNLEVDSPQLCLRFDANGNLLSQFPAVSPGECESESKFEIPLRFLKVLTAKIILQQQSRPEFSIDQINVAAIIDERIKVSVQTTDLLAGEAKFFCNLDSQTLAGQSSLALKRLRIDSKNLHTLPLVPEAFKQSISDVFLSTDHVAEATVNAESQAMLSIAADSVRCVGDVRLNVVDMEYDKVRCEPINLLLNLDALLPSYQWEQRQGRLAISMHSGGVSVASIANRLGWSAASGQISCDAQCQIPLQSYDRIESYTGELLLRSKSMASGETQLADSDMRVSIESGIAQLTLSDGRIFENGRHAATLVAAANFPLVGHEECKFELQCSELSLPAIAQITAAPMNPCSGAISMKLVASASSQHIANPESWAALLTLDSHDLTVIGEPIEHLTAEVRLEAGQLAVPLAQLQWHDCLAKFNARGNVLIDGKLSGKLSVETIQLEQIAQLANRFSQQAIPLLGTAKLDGTLSANCWSLDWSARGELSCQEVKVGPCRIGQSQLAWDANRQHVRLQSSSEDFLGGNYLASVDVRELDWTNAVIALDATQLSVPGLVALAQQFGNASSAKKMANLPATGTLACHLHATKLVSLSTLKLDASVATHAASLHRVPFEISKLSLNVADGNVHLTSAGNIAGGPLAIVADVTGLQKLAQIDGPSALTRLPITGSVKVEKLPLENLLRLADMQSSLRGVAGLIDVQIHRTDKDVSDGSWLHGAIGLTQLRYQNARLTDRLQSNFSIRDNTCSINQINGDLADGRLLGGAMLVLDRQPVGHFELLLSHLNLHKLATPLGRQSANLSGTANLKVYGRIGRQIEGHALLEIDNALASSIVVREIRMPIEYSVGIDSGVASWRTQNSTIETGGGKILVTSRGRWSNGLDMNTAINLNNIDTAKLQRGASSGGGVIDGIVKLNAKRAQQMKDIVGIFDADISQVQATSLPIVEELGAFLNLSNYGNSDKGRIYGRLSNGIAHLEHARLQTASALIVAEGTAQLNGQLDIDVVASTGQTGPIDGIVDLASSPIMLAAPAPIALVVKANELLKDRVVYVHVGGVADRPVIRLQPGKQLNQEVLKFFLTDSLQTAKNFGTAQQNRSTYR